MAAEMSDDMERRLAENLIASYDGAQAEWEKIVNSPEYESNPFEFSKEYETYEDALLELVHSFASIVRDKFALPEREEADETAGA
jgi:hypothetical protein